MSNPRDVSLSLFYFGVSLMNIKDNELAQTVPVMCFIIWMEDKKYGHIIIQSDEGRRTILDKDSSEIWRKIDGYTTVSEIIGQTEMQKAKVIKRLLDMSEQGLIVLKNIRGSIWESEEQESG